MQRNCLSPALRTHTCSVEYSQMCQYTHSLFCKLNSGFMEAKFNSWWYNTGFRGFHSNHSKLSRFSRSKSRRFMINLITPQLIQYKTHTSIVFTIDKENYWKNVHSRLLCSQLINTAKIHG